MWGAGIDRGYECSGVERTMVEARSSFYFCRVMRVSCTSLLLLQLRESVRDAWCSYAIAMPFIRFLMLKIESTCGIPPLTTRIVEVQITQCSYRRSARITTPVQCMADKSPSAPRVALALTIRPSQFPIATARPTWIDRGCRVDESNWTYLAEANLVSETNLQM